ncbi:MAG TPA: helix-turn-helix domain-containing protein [Gemmatimonadaceae bacterium]
MTRIRRSSTSASSEATRVRVLSLLREGAWTVEDLAERLDVTDNAVRFHLSALEGEGSVIKQGVRRGGGAGQPAALYSLSAEAEDSFSRAYAPVLNACLAELHEVLPTPQLMAFLKRVGKRLAAAITPPDATLPRRVAAMSSILNSWGGLTTVEKSGDALQIVGRACPLSRAVESDHCVCTAVTALVAEVVSADVKERCDRSGRPRCCFEVTPRRVSS